MQRLKYAYIRGRKQISCQLHLISNKVILGLPISKVTNMSFDTPLSQYRGFAVDRDSPSHPFEATRLIAIPALALWGSPRQFRYPASPCRGPRYPGSTQEGLPETPDTQAYPMEPPRWISQFVVNYHLSPLATARRIHCEWVQRAKSETLWTQRKKNIKFFGLSEIKLIVNQCGKTRIGIPIIRSPSRW